MNWKLLLGIVLLLAIQIGLSEMVVDELREHAFLVLNFPNSSYAFSETSFFVVNNIDKREMYLTLQLIPIPSGLVCYSQHSWCDNSSWDTTFEVNYVGKNGVVNKVVGDTISCWNWWNVGGIAPLCDPEYHWLDIFHLFPIYHCTVPSQLDVLTSIEENKTLCPTVSIPFTPDDDYFNISFNMTPSESGKALPNLNVRVFTYSTAYANRPTTYSSTANKSLLNIGELIRIQSNIIRLFYYSLIIFLIVMGILVFVGGIPLLIKWLIRKLVK